MSREIGNQVTQVTNHFLQVNVAQDWDDNYKKRERERQGDRAGKGKDERASEERILLN